MATPAKRELSHHLNSSFRQVIFRQSFLAYLWFSFRSPFENMSYIFVLEPLNHTYIILLIINDHCCKQNYNLNLITTCKKKNWTRKPLELRNWCGQIISRNTTTQSLWRLKFFVVLSVTGSWNRFGKTDNEWVYLFGWHNHEVRFISIFLHRKLVE